MIRAAIAGLGWWGKHMVRRMADSDELRIVAAIDTSDVQAAFAAEYGVTLTTRWDDVLNDPEIDAVILCTPHSLHTAQVLAITKAGKHVFCEKPLALNRADAELDPGGAAGLHRALGVGAVESQRLLAEHMLAGLGDRQHLRGVQRMRGAQDHGVDVRIIQHVIPMRGECHAVLGGEGGLHVRGVDGGDDAKLIGIRHATDHVLAPPAEAGDCGADHAALLLLL